MFWKYTSFETKLLLKNRKSWFISVFLLIFFILFFMYYSQETPIPLDAKKSSETNSSYAVFEYLDQQRHDLPEVAEVYDYHTQIQSLLGMQTWFIGKGDDSEQYIENGLEINRLRLEVHELGNKGIPDHLIVPREEILKEDALLHYIKDNNLPIESDSFATNHYISNVLTMFSGLLFLVIVLISGNEMLVYEQRHQSVLRGFPLSFMQKITSKVMIHFIYLYIFLLLGFTIGSVYVAKKFDAGEFSFPILVYKNEDYIAISTGQYLVYIFLGLALATILILVLSILLNMLFKNAFANILVGLGIFLLPDIAMAAGFKATFLHPIKYIDMFKVLSGDLVTELGNSSIDYWNAMTTLGIITILLIGVIYAINKFTYQRVPKDVPLEKAF
ncbi:ABC transporter permease [Paucisalibacillus sp. EB02]|uniref:ABC transporter permease n=1 Tax=Paucisalibacillus sp. EB02 TaxID=1347087 RepID=UPI0005AAF6AC|nr:ABC transporter permease [Paucisalibacillus sp. EB02]